MDYGLTSFLSAFRYYLINIFTSTYDSGNMYRLYFVLFLILYLLLINICLWEWGRCCGTFGQALFKICQKRKNPKVTAANLQVIEVSKVVILNVKKVPAFSAKVIRPKHGLPNSQSQRSQPATQHLKNCEVIDFLPSRSYLIRISI